MSRREGRVSEQNAVTAALKSLSAFEESPFIVMCRKSEVDTNDA